MGELVRSRVLRALGLGTLWVQLDQMQLRLRSVEDRLRRLDGLGVPPRSLDDVGQRGER